MADDLFATKAPLRIITGPAGTGKTEALVRRAAELVAGGAAASSVALFAATPAACDALGVRLAAAFADAGLPSTPDALPHVLTAFEYEMALLSLPEARHALNREPRVMLRFEENIFMEDMKTSGVQPKRLGDMLRFLYRSSCDLEHMTRDWFFNDEEEKVFGLLGQLQDYYGCYVRQMVPYYALRFAKDFPKVTAGHGFAHVLADDFQLLTKASQCLLALAARQSLTVAADPQAACTALEDYPYPAGVEELAAANEGCERVTLAASYAAAGVREALNELLADEALAGKPLLEAATAAGAAALAEGAVAPVTCAFAEPQNELEGVAAMVQSLRKLGFADADIAVTAPKSLWESNLAKALRAAGIPVAAMHRPNVSGDVRTLETSFEGRVVTLLRLLADPSNQLALRCWCGFGDYLANSTIFTDMAKARVHLAIGTTDIQMTAGENALFAQQRERVLSALAQARELLPQLVGLGGEALVRAAAAAVAPDAELPPRFLRAFGTLSQDMDAEAVLASLERNVFLPHFVGNGVNLGLTCDFAGLRPRAVIASGMVNGLTPESRYFDPTSVERDKRPAMLAKEAAKAYAAAGRAQESLRFTYFTSVGLVEAEHMRLKVERVRLLNGRRMCEVHPSETIRALTGVRFND